MNKRHPVHFLLIHLTTSRRLRMIMKVIEIGVIYEKEAK